MSTGRDVLKYPEVRTTILLEINLALLKCNYVYWKKYLDSQYMLNCLTDLYKLTHVGSFAELVTEYILIYSPLHSLVSFEKQLAHALEINSPSQIKKVCHEFKCPFEETSRSFLNLFKLGLTQNTDQIQEELRNIGKLSIFGPYIQLGICARNPHDITSDSMPLIFNYLD